jgi:dolichyl-phosphate beta-glucosyltransferase
MKISVIIPAYNEELKIAKTVKEIVDYFEARPLLTSEIIVVDDGSVDQTAKIVDELNQPSVRLLKHEHNQGKGAAVKSGMLKAEGDAYLFLDADGSTKINELDKFLPYLEQFDIVIASRALPESQITIHQSRLREICGIFGNYFFRFIWSLPFKDTQCGFKLFNNKARELFIDLKSVGWGFDMELLWRAAKKQLRIKELPVTWQHYKSSSFNSKAYFQVLVEVLKIRLIRLRASLRRD